MQIGIEVGKVRHFVALARTKAQVKSLLGFTCFVRWSRRPNVEIVREFCNTVSVSVPQSLFSAATRGILTGVECLLARSLLKIGIGGKVRESRGRVIRWWNCQLLKVGVRSCLPQVRERMCLPTKDSSPSSFQVADSQTKALFHSTPTPWLPNWLLDL